MNPASSPSIPYLLFMVLEAILGLVLVVLVLLHAPKGEGMGGIGGGATLFTGKRDAEAGLDRVTWITAGLFMFVCLLLGFGIIK